MMAHGNAFDSAAPAGQPPRSPDSIPLILPSTASYRTRGDACHFLVQRSKTANQKKPLLLFSSRWPDPCARLNCRQLFFDKPTVHFQAPVDARSQVRQLTASTVHFRLPVSTTFRIDVDRSDDTVPDILYTRMSSVITLQLEPISSKQEAYQSWRARDGPRSAFSLNAPW